MSTISLYVTDEEEAADAARAARIERTYGVVVLRAPGSIRLYRKVLDGYVYHSIRRGRYDPVDGDNQGALVGDIDDADVPTTADALVDLCRRLEAENEAEARRERAAQRKAVIPIRDGAKFWIDDHQFFLTRLRPIAGARHSVEVVDEFNGRRAAEIVVGANEVANGLSAKEILKRFKTARKAMRKTVK